MILILPFVLVHEISHILFIWIAGVSKGWMIRVTDNSIGFCFKNEILTVNRFQAKLMLLIPLGPIFPFLLTMFLCFKYIHAIPTVIAFYVIIGAIRGLLPSRADWACFKNFWEILNGKEEQTE
jgi:hypothetical protein